MNKKLIIFSKYINTMLGLEPLMYGIIIILYIYITICKIK